MRFQWKIFISLILFSQLTLAKQPNLRTSGLVVTEQRLATQVGMNILKEGGNAVDAAVAVGYALAVVDPCCGNIGGGGFMLIHLANQKNKNIFINFREQASHRATKNMYLAEPSSDNSLHGYLAVAVPGTVLGLETALQKYGTLPRQHLMRPAIELAKKGFVVTPYQAKLFDKFAKEFKKQPNIQKIFFKNNHPLQAGDLLKQPDLANTLNLIAKDGSKVFYTGSIAQKIVDASHQNGGILTLSDFANYHVEITKPLQCEYRGYRILTSPPPGSGTTLCEILNILQNIPLQQLGFRSEKSVLDIIEAMGFGFADRNQQLGDPDFIHNSLDHLLSKNYTLELSKKILSHQQTHRSKRFNYSVVKEQSNTTHYSIIDQYGNAVSLTYTLNGNFGAGVIASNTGFFLNNEMDDFASGSNKPNQFGLIQQQHANAIQAGKRPLSSMTPTIVFKGNHLWLILGSPGGPRIITSTLLTLLNLIDYHFNLQQAINEPRFHFQGQPDTIFIEPNAFSHTVSVSLEKAGYAIAIEKPWGAVAAILVRPNGSVIGAIDSRRPDG